LGDKQFGISGRHGWRAYRRYAKLWRLSFRSIAQLERGPFPGTVAICAREAEYEQQVTLNEELRTPVVSIGFFFISS
jgi:hypothetical protein